ncbi:helix-turn-helix domain-containing protein [Clostridium butyricum]|nr:helix-turn-helix transcriptional regulator [Clostridium butyricum]
MSLGSNIKRIRNNRGLTQKELAEKLQVNINTIQNYENGRREPKTKVIENLGKILDVSLSEFFLDDDPKKEEENINKLKSEIPESRKRLINESPSNQKYNDDNCKGENLLDEL